MPCPLGIIADSGLVGSLIPGYYAGSLILCARFLGIEHTASDRVTAIFSTRGDGGILEVPLGSPSATAEVTVLDGNMVPIDPSLSHARRVEAASVAVETLVLADSLEVGAHYGLWVRIKCSVFSMGEWGAIPGCPDVRTRVREALANGGAIPYEDFDTWLILPAGVLPVDPSPSPHYAWATPTSRGWLYVDPPELTWPPDQPCGPDIDHQEGWRPGVGAVVTCTRLITTVDWAIDGEQGLGLLLDFGIPLREGDTARTHTVMWLGQPTDRVPVMFLQPPSAHTRRSAIITDISVTELLGRLVATHPMMLPLEVFFATDDACASELCESHRAAAWFNEALFEAIRGDGPAPEGVLTSAVFILSGAPPG